MYVVVYVQINIIIFYCAEIVILLSVSTWLNKKIFEPQRQIVFFVFIKAGKRKILSLW